MKLKALLFWIHRWLGIGMCLLFALWFASGMIMMYVEYPELSEGERLDQLPALDLEAVTHSPLSAAAAVRSESVFSSVKLTTVLDRPAYEFTGFNGLPFLVFADTGEEIGDIAEATALEAARLSSTALQGSSPSYDALVEMDQWSISSSHNAYRPLHRIAMNDPAGSVFYVSDRTGQIVLETTEAERFWNWLGSTIHWIYPLQLRRNAALWTDVIVYASLIGLVSIVTGGIVGFMRIRPTSPFGKRSLSPYKSWMKWHHLIGLGSLVFITTFMFSGLMSMGPWGIFSSSTSPFPQIARYYGSDSLRLSALPMPAASAIDSTAKEIHWHRIQDAYFYSRVSSATDVTTVLSEERSSDPAEDMFSLVKSNVPKLLPNANLLSLERIEEQDSYYYSRRNNHRPLPVYRAIFDDAESTWYHIDVDNGQIVNRVTDANRLERWLFNGLHSLDFQPLLRHRPVWDVIMLLLSLIGLAFSITAVVIGWRRLTTN